MFKTELIENKSLGEVCTVATHSSGLKIFIVEKPLFRSSYAVFGTKYGSIDNGFRIDGETVNVPEGIAHFLEHKLFESEDGDAFVRFSKTGAYANAYTSFDRTCYLFSCSDKVYENLEILLDFVTHPYFTAETVSKEQGIIGQEIRMYDDSPAWRVLFNMLESMYHNHSVKVDIAGTVDSIAKITADHLYKCYNTFYDLSNMFLCIAGNVSADEVLKVAERVLKSGGGSHFERAIVNEPNGIIKNYVSEKLEVAQPLFCIGFKEVCEEGKDRSEHELVSTQILLELIAGEMSPLYSELTDKGLINDEFESEYFTGRGFAVTMFSGESRDPNAVADAVKSEIAHIKNTGIDRRLFAAIKREMYGSAIRAYNSSKSICSALVGSAISDDKVFGSIDVLRNITERDVMKRIELLDFDKMVLSVIEPKTQE